MSDICNREKPYSTQDWSQPPSAQIFQVHHCGGLELEHLLACLALSQGTQVELIELLHGGWRGCRNHLKIRMSRRGALGHHIMRRQEKSTHHRGIGDTCSIRPFGRTEIREPIRNEPNAMFQSRLLNREFPLILVKFADKCVPILWIRALATLEGQ